MKKILHWCTEETNAVHDIRTRLLKRLAFVLLAVCALNIPIRAEAATILELNPGDFRSDVTTDTLLRATHYARSVRTGDSTSRIDLAYATVENPVPNVITAQSWARRCVSFEAVYCSLGRYEAGAVGIIGKSFRVAAGATEGQTIPVTLRFMVDRIGGLITLGPGATAGLRISVTVLDLDTGRSAMYESIEDTHEGSLLGSWTLIKVIPVPLPTGGAAANNEYRVNTLSLVRGHTYQIRLAVSTSASASYLPYVATAGAAVSVSPHPIGLAGSVPSIDPATYQVRLKNLEIEVAQEGQQGVGELLLIIDQLRNEISQLHEQYDALVDDIAWLHSGHNDLAGENELRMGEIADLNSRIQQLQNSVDRLLKRKKDDEHEHEDKNRQRR